MDYPEREVRHQQEEPSTDTTVPGLYSDLVLCGHYRLIKWIGGGGMGEVWLAEDTAILRKCALKFLPEVLRRDEIAQERLRDEAILLARLHHPHIVTLYAREPDQGFTFLVFDYVPGYEPRPGDRRQDLAVHIHREKKLPETEVRRLLPSIFDAVHHAHTFHDDIVKNGIVHRDIKPRNILLDRDGRPIVTDFGIARSIQSSVSRLTGAQLHGGTLPYMSPEQIRGRPPTPRDDIYSLGMTIWEMLMGEAPFSDGDIVWRHFNDEVPAIEGVSAEMNALIQKATAKKPEDRWQFCAEMKEALGKSGTSEIQDLVGAAADHKGPVNSPKGKRLERTDEKRTFFFRRRKSSPSVEGKASSSNAKTPGESEITDWNQVVSQSDWSDSAVVVVGRHFGALVRGLWGLIDRILVVLCVWILSTLFTSIALRTLEIRLRRHVVHRMSSDFLKSLRFGTKEGRQIVSRLRRASGKEFKAPYMIPVVMLLLPVLLLVTSPLYVSGPLPRHTESEYLDWLVFFVEGNGWWSGYGANVPFPVWTFVFYGLVCLYCLYCLFLLLRVTHRFCSHRTVEFLAAAFHLNDLSALRDSVPGIKRRNRRLYVLAILPALPHPFTVFPSFGFVILIAVFTYRRHLRWEEETGIDRVWKQATGAET